MVHLIKSPATPKQVLEMLEFLETYIKVAVDIKQKILAGGGVMHADCEALLLQHGSKQADIWGADWQPRVKKVVFNSLINIRPRQNNRSMEIQNEKIKDDVEAVVKKLLDI